VAKPCKHSQAARQQARQAGPTFRVRPAPGLVQLLAHQVTYELLEPLINVVVALRARGGEGGARGTWCSAGWKDSTIDMHPDVSVTLMYLSP
jgi:hypothetical protein